MGRMQRVGVGVALIGVVAVFVAFGVFWLLVTAPQQLAYAAAPTRSAVLAHWLFGIIRHILAWL